MSNMSFVCQYSSVQSIDRLGLFFFSFLFFLGGRKTRRTIQRRSSSSLFCGGHREQCWHGQGRPLFHIVHPVQYSVAHEVGENEKTVVFTTNLWSNKNSLGHGSVPKLQWGSANAEIKDISVENPELKGSPFKVWSRSEYSQAR